MTGPIRIATTILLLAGLGACGSDEGRRSAPSSAPTVVATAPMTTIPPAPAPVVAADQSGCSGIGPPPPAPELTWQVGNELRSAKGCILRFTTDEYTPLRPAWAPGGDALLVDVSLASYVVTATGEQSLPEAGPWPLADDGSVVSDESVVRSPYDDTAVARYTAGGCGGPPHAEATLQGRRLSLEGTPVEHAPPEAWLPDGTLLFLDRGESCDYSPGTLWAFKDGRATEVADGVFDVAIRPAGTAPSASGG